MKKLSIITGITALALSLSTAVIAEEVEVEQPKTSGWFIGASVGKISGDGIDEIKGFGASVGGSSKVMYGYRYNEYFALEQAWNNFGTIKVVGETITNVGLTTEVVLTFPVNDTVKPFIKAGLVSWSLESDYYSESGNDLIYGVGLTVALGKFGLTVEHQISDGDAAWTSFGVKYHF